MADRTDGSADETPAGETPAGETPAGETPADERRTSPQPTRSPRPGASAASRARRIGGRPAGAAQTAQTARTARTPSETAATQSEAGSDTSAGSSATPGAKVRGTRVSVAKASSTKAPSTKAPGTKAVKTAASGRTPDRGRPTRDAPVELPAWVRWAPAAILAAGVIAMAIVLFLASAGVWRGKLGVKAERDQVLSSAKDCVAAVSTYKYTDLAAYRAHGLDCATGQFKADFAKSVDKVIKPQAPKVKATQTAKIDKAGLQSVRDGQWTVVVYGQVNVTNTSTPKGRLDPLGAVVRMQRAHGRWLIVKLDLLSGNGIS